MYIFILQTAVNPMKRRNTQSPKYAERFKFNGLRFGIPHIALYVLNMDRRWRYIKHDFLYC